MTENEKIVLKALINNGEVSIKELNRLTKLSDFDIMISLHTLKVIRLVKQVKDLNILYYRVTSDWLNKIIDGCDLG